MPVCRGQELDRCDGHSGSGPPPRHSSGRARPQPWAGRPFSDDRPPTSREHYRRGAPLVGALAGARRTQAGPHRTVTH